MLSMSETQIRKKWNKFSLQEIPSSLKSISRCLKQLLNRDGDSIVKTYAMLCLQDIDAQMLTGFLEYENANMRRIRIK